MNPLSYTAALDCARALRSVDDATDNDAIRHMLNAREAADVAIDMDTQPQEWRILIQMLQGPVGKRWVDCGVGPWDDFTKAEIFAQDNIYGHWKLCCVIPELSCDSEDD